MQGAEKRKREEERVIRFRIYVQNRRHSTADVREVEVPVVYVGVPSHDTCGHREDDEEDPCTALSDSDPVPCFYVRQLSDTLGVTASWAHKLKKRLVTSIVSRGCRCKPDTLLPLGGGGLAVPIFFVPFLFDMDSFWRAGTCKAACDEARSLLRGDAKALCQLDRNERIASKRVSSENGDSDALRRLTERVETIEKRIMAMEQRQQH
jgi:hypothetical protein